MDLYPALPSLHWQQRNTEALEHVREQLLYVQAKDVARLVFWVCYLTLTSRIGEPLRILQERLDQGLGCLTPGLTRPAITSPRFTTH